LKIKYVYQNYLEILENKPWQIGRQDVKVFLDEFYNIKLNGSYGGILNKSIEEEKKYDTNKMLSYYYHTVFIDRYAFRVMVNGVIKPLSLVYVIGKKKSGIYDLLGIYYLPENNFDYIFKDIKKRKVRHISFIITKMHNINAIKKDLGLYFKRTKCQSCMANLYKRIIKYSLIDKNDVENIDEMLSAKTLNTAERILKTHILRGEIDKNIKHLKTSFLI
jgi:transposase-like protein